MSRAHSITILLLQLLTSQAFSYTLVLQKVIIQSILKIRKEVQYKMQVAFLYFQSSTLIEHYSNTYNRRKTAQDYSFSMLFHLWFCVKLNRHT